MAKITYYGNLTPQNPMYGISHKNIAKNWLKKTGKPRL